MPNPKSNSRSKPSRKGEEQPVYAFQFNAANPGSGKSQHAIIYALTEANLNQSKTLFVLQTIALLDEQVERAAKQAEVMDLAHIPIQAIHADNGSGNVKQRILNHMAATPQDEPELLFVSLTTFLDIHPWPNKHAWKTVFVDEAFNPVADLSMQLVDNSRVVTDRIKLVDPTQKFSRLKPAYGAEVRDSVNNELKQKDLVNKGVLHTLLARLVNPNFTLYAHVETWRNTLAGVFDESDPRLFIYSEVNASAFAGFGNVVFMGAWLQNHAFFKLWRQQKHTFTAHRYLAATVTQRSWNRERDTILYFTERHWTGSYAKKPLADGITPLGHMDAYLRDQLGDFPFGWAQNSRATTCYQDLGGTKMPPRAAGSNAFSHLECLVSLTAMLPHPNMWKFLEWRGLTDDDIRKEFYWLPLAQFMTRGADRTAGYSDKMIKVVPDLPAARFLQELFNSRLQRVGTIPVDDPKVVFNGKSGRPRGHQNKGGRPRGSSKSDADRKAIKAVQNRAAYQRRAQQGSAAIP